MRASMRRILFMALLVLAGPLPAHDAWASDVSWDATSGNWSTASKWTGGEPTASDNASVKGTVTIDSTGEVCQNLKLGKDSGTTGSVNMTAGDLGVCGSEDIGYNGSGNFTHTGGQHSTVSWASLGTNSDSSGQYTLRGNAATWSVGGGLVVGYAGQGVLIIDSAGRLTSGYAEIGSNSVKDNTVTVDGTSSCWTNNGTLQIGGRDDTWLPGGTVGDYSGSGTLEIKNGGSCSTERALVGPGGSAANGIVKVHGHSDAGPSTWTIAGVVHVGYAGSGDLQISDGGAVSSDECHIACLPGSMGTATVTGPGSIWTTTGKFVVGGYHDVDDSGESEGPGGSGTLNVEHQATLQVGGTLTVFGSGTGPGTVNLGTSTPDGGLISADQLVLNSSAILNTYPGSTLRVNGLSGAGFGSSVQVAGSLEIGHSAGQNCGNYTRTSGESLDVGENLTVGKDATGTLTLEYGGTLVTHGTASIGAQGGAGNGTVTVAYSGSNWTALGDLWVGKGGTGKLEINNWATASTQYTCIGQFGSGTVTVDGSRSIWTCNGWLDVGREYSSTGTLNIQSGGSVSVLGGASIGRFTGVPSGANGTVTVKDSGQWTVSQGLFVGDGATGALTISSAGSVSSLQSAAIGAEAGSHGSVLVTDTDSEWNVSGDLGVGLYGTGSLEISRGAVVTNGGDACVGYSAGSTGTVTITDTDSTWHCGHLYIGGTPWASAPTGGLITGTVTVINDGTLEALATTVWDAGNLQLNCEIHTGSFTVSPGGTFDHRGGALTIDGGTLDLGTPNPVIDGPNLLSPPTVKLVNNATASFPGTVTVGQANGGGFEVRGGSRVTSNSGALGTGGISSATATVDGIGSTWTNLDYLCVGGEGHGDMTISGGGGVSDVRAYIARLPASGGLVNVDGAGSRWTNSMLYVAGDETAAGGTGALTIGNDAAVVVADTLTIWNSGAVNLGGGMLTAGIIDHQHGGAFNFSGGRLSAATFLGDLVNDGGTIAPGASPGVTTIFGDLTINGGTLEIEIGGLLPGTDFDQLAIVGVAALGGTLEASVIGGYTPSLGDSFAVMTFNSRTGDFDHYDGLYLAGGLRLEPRFTSGSLLLDVVPEPNALMLVMVGALLAAGYGICRRLT